MDPWNWTVDEVVSSLCKVRDVWKARPSSRLPDPVEFELMLRENDVDGATLLEQIDNETLKNDFGVKSLGERSSILYAVGRLRSQSTRWIAHQGTIEALKTRVNKEAEVHNPNEPSDLNSTHVVLNSPIQETDNIIDQTAHGLISTNVDDRITKARPGEFLVTEGGKKRRKLQLGPENAAKHSATKDPVWTFPSFNPTHNYLRRVPIPLDEIFYSGLRNGQPVLDDSGDDCLNDNVSDFTLIRSDLGRLPGDQLYVSRRLKHFLYSGPEQFDETRIVRYPYPERLLVNSRTRRSATLFVISPSEVSATKRDAKLIAYGGAELISENDEAKIDEANVDNSWDYILSKYPCNAPNDEILPQYAQSGSENDYAGSLLDELEEEELEMEADQNQKTKSYSKFDASAVVDEEIDKCRKLWCDKMLQKRHQIAWTTWRKAQGRNRSIVIEETEAVLESLQVRLQKLKTELCSYSWDSMKLLRKQCQCLSHTIEDEEDLTWKLSLWRETNPPARTFVTRTKRPSTKVEPSEDGDSCGSPGSVSDGLEDFIDVDEIDNLPGTEASRNSETLKSNEGQDNAAPRKSAHVDFDNSTHMALRLSGPPDADVTENQWPEQLKETTENYQASQSDDSVLGQDSVNANNSTFGFAPGEMVDLTMSSPPPYADADDLFTDSEHDRVEDATTQEIEAWSWRDLDEQGDRKRIVLKLLQSVDDFLREEVQRCFLKYSHEKLQVQVRAALDSLLRNENADWELKSDKHLVISTVCKLFVCWNDGSHRHFKCEIPLPILAGAKDVADFGSFYTFMKSLSQLTNHYESEGSSAELSHGSVDVTCGSDDLSPRKKRQRAVAKNQRGLALREDAHERHLKGQLRARQLMSSVTSSDPAERNEGVLVNVIKEKSEDPIFLNSHIATRIKPHQIRGVQFLWREIVSASELQGCLLAHTMGLGKTMQTISLLVTIAEAAASSNRSIVNQIPDSLRQSQTLVICPPGLIENWKIEFRSWIPTDVERHLGPVLDISAQDDEPQRFGTIFQWQEEGGILVIGYEMFRRLLENTSAPARVAEILLKGPNIVIADEAHKMKQATSKITKAASKFRTMSRIALTGSPLANNLHDYYSMINWVAPGYLGDPVEFKAYYQEPIEEGTYYDSTRAEQRISLKKLRALIHDIEPKVNRADASVIQNETKPKTEFVIKLPLTPWQTAAYQDFVRAVLNHEDIEYIKVKIFDWMHFMCLLCNHPSLFLKGLKERAEETAKRSLDPSDSETPVALSGVSGEAIEADTAEKPDYAANQGNTENYTGTAAIEHFSSMVRRQSKILEEQGIVDRFDPSLSHKTAIIKKIILKSKELGDRVLIFTQRLDTIMYLDEHLIKKFPITVKTVRLSGKTAPADRVRLVEEFNNGNADVFLISTKAGGLGLNISGANRVILVDFSFNPIYEEQAIARAYRIGQKKEVFVYHLVTGGTYEEKLHNVTIFKKQLAQRVVDKKNPARAASKNFEYLFEPKEVPQENLHLEQLIGKDSIMDDILDSEAGKFVRALHTTETLNAETNEELTPEELHEVNEMINDNQLRKRDHAAWEKKRLEIQRGVLLGPTPGHPGPPPYTESQKTHLPSQQGQVTPSANENHLSHALNGIGYRTLPWQHTHQT